MQKPINLIIFLILAYSQIIQSGKDYYSILGVRRNASPQEIRRAFKKLSLKYHPDKNVDRKEWAEKKFQEMIGAYDILKDPKKREIYDKHGEEALNEHIQRESQGDQGQNFGNFGGFQNFHGSFEDFFSNAGGGFNFNFGGGGFGEQRQQKQQQQQKQQEKFFEQSDVFELSIGSLSKFFRRQEVWVILFYQPDQEESKALKDIWIELANKFYGIFKVGAVNCQDEPEVCEEEFSIHRFPTIKAFPANLRGKSKIYRGQNDVNRIAGFAVAEMESFVNFVSENLYQSFVEQEQDKNKIILFTQKKSTPPLFKALSKDFKGKLVFGEVRASDENLIKKFQIKNFPTLMVLTDPYNYKGVIYEGVYKKDQIMKFLREYSYQSPQKKNRADSGKASELNQKVINGGSCGSSDSRLCLLAILSDDKKNNYIELLNQIASEYIEDPIGFFYIEQKWINYSNVFSQIDKIPAILVIKGKRERYLQYTKETIDKKNLESFIDDLLGGGGNYKKMLDKLQNHVASVKSEL